MSNAILNELSIGPRSVICSACAAPLDVSTGRWVARNPDATWGDGYWVCHPIVPWLGFDAILQRQRDYDIARFKNEVLGLSTMTGDHVVTRAELEACCRPNEMAKSRKDIPTKYRPRLVAGIDWGAGGVARTVLVIRLTMLAGVDAPHSSGRETQGALIPVNERSHFDA